MTKFFFIFNTLFLSLATSGWSSEIHCNHYWGNKKNLEPSSGVSVGNDVGQSKYGTDGAYKCDIEIIKQDVIQGKYLYLGEIGDASYVELTSGPLGAYNSLPINHGLSPEPGDQARYERFIPFIIPARDIYQADGMHHFTLYYRDLVPKQSGLRSGPPSLELIGGTFKRFLRNSPGLTYHLAQTLILFLLAFSVWTWSNVTVKRRLKFFIALLASSAVIVSISALPRYYFRDPNDAIRLNDYLNIFGFGIALLPFSEFIFPKSNHASKKLFLIWILLAASTSFYLSTLSLDSKMYTPLYCGFILLEAGLAPLATAALLWRRKLQTSLSARPLYSVQWILIALSSLMSWDILVNVFIHNFSAYFVSHYLYFPTCFGTLIQLQRLEPQKRSSFIDNLRRLTTEGTEQVVADGGRSFTLSPYAEGLASLVQAQRVGLQVVRKDRAWFLGFFGSYTNPSKENEIRPSSPSRRALDTGNIILEDTIHTETGLPTSLVVIPLHQGSHVIGLLFISNFQFGFISPFIQQQLLTIQEHCQLLFANLSLTINLRETVTILEMGRLRVPKVQLESEDYFRSNFNVSRTMRAPAFIMGDLASSVRLRSEFREAITQAIDQSLRYIWEHFRHLGITVTREKGDFVTILAQNLDSDKTELDASLRCLEILRFLSNPSDDYKIIPKRLGVTLDFQFRIAMSQVERPNDISVTPQFTALTDTQIDCAARTINEIAAGGECILLEHVHNRLPPELSSMFVELPPHRIRGVDRSVRLFKLRTSSRRIA